MLDCRAVMEVLWDYIDGELPASKVAAVREHIEICKRCYPQYAFQIAFLEALAALKESVPPPSPELRGRVRELMSSNL